MIYDVFAWLGWSFEAHTAAQWLWLAVLTIVVLYTLKRVT